MLEVFDSGESNAEQDVLPMLQEAYRESAIMQLAKKYHGLALLWEHRYYGESLPFSIPSGEFGVSAPFSCDHQSERISGIFQRLRVNIPIPNI